MKVYEMTIADIASEIFDKGEDFAEKIFNDINELARNKFIEINLLKQQLAEKDCRIEELEGQFAYECECNKQLVELQKQLAEKDKEIESLTKRTDRYENMFRSRIKRTGDMQKDIDLYMKQLAIQELEKVNSVLYESHYKKIGNKYYATLEDIENVISEQIELLKGEKNNG